jgi:replicative DNA helicase Mcm
MARAENTEIIDSFEEFYRTYYRNEIGELARKYPNDQRSLYVSWGDLYRFDQSLAEDVRTQPDQFREYAEEALRLYDLPVDVSLGQAHVRVHDLPETTEIRDIRAHHYGQLVSIRGIIRKATNVRPKIQEAAFECQRCGSLTRIPQTGGDFHPPHECQGCERQGPFRINFDQSEFVDAQKLRVQESPEGLRGGERPQNIDVNIEDDITGEVTAGDTVRMTGVLHLDQQQSQGEKSTMFDIYMDGVAIDVEDDRFEDMDITEEDKKRIISLSDEDDIYEQMISSMAPSIYGYDEEKLAIILQLFSGVTKDLPDGSRIRGDMHILLIGDPGTGKSQLLQYVRNIAPRSVYTAGKGSSAAGLCVTGDTRIHTKEGFRPIEELAKEEHPEPVETDTAAPYSTEVYTYDEGSKEIEQQDTSHIWRMPEKPCRRIETATGKELETSVNTPVLTCGEQGIQWKQISDIGQGEHVAVPKYNNIERTTPSVDEYIEFTNEKVRLTDNSIEFIREKLSDRFGTLRNAAAELGLSEDFIYSSLPNRFIPIKKLNTLLASIASSYNDVTIKRTMLRHGDNIRLPDEFDDDLLYLLGLVFGDGDIALSRRGENRGLVRISNSDESLLQRAIDIIEDIFDKQVEIEYQEERVPCIRINSATIARFFSNLGMQTPKDDLKLDSRLTTAEHTDAFLRGLLDANGSVSARTNGGSSIHFSTISDKLAEQVQFMLETYGIRSRCRDQDRRRKYTLPTGQTIETKKIQTHIELYGRDIDTYATEIGFESAQKQVALDRIVNDTKRKEETLPIGAALQTVDGPTGKYHTNLERGDNPGRSRACAILNDLDLGSVTPPVENAVQADLCWDEVVASVDTGENQVYDLTVPETNNFIGNGIVTHNTAAAVRDDFSDGQQWSLEAGALVLADQGIAAVDELDKMRCVTGETLVETFNSGAVPIHELVSNAANHENGEIEQLENGRTIRGTDVDVWTMTDDSHIVPRSVMAIHEYDAPERLHEVTLESGETLTTTTDHPFFVFENGERIEKPAVDLAANDLVFIPERTAATDGGIDTRPQSQPNTLETSLSEHDSRITDVSYSRVEHTQTIDDHAFDAVYDLTVEGTHNFIANGMVVHNSEDRSAMHEALEQQEISVSKAGINATLKSRCSLLGAANPKYGRFDEFESFGEQIDLEPALISRFDIIFTVTDKPDPEKDKDLAQHIVNTNYAGELHTHRTETSTSNVSQKEVNSVTEDVEPSIDADLLRKYIAYAKRSCFPMMTEEAKEAIEDFYVDLRSQGTDSDSPVPVTARKLEALVRLAEASARIRLSDTVETEDVNRILEIVTASLEDIGLDPETGEFDADVVETGTSKSQRDRIRNIKGIISEIEDEYDDDGAPFEDVLERAEAVGMDRSKAEHEIEKLRRQGDVYEPNNGRIRTVGI